MPAQITTILDKLQALYPESVCALNFSSPLQLLIATILSAQTTDKRVNLVTPDLFAAYPDAYALAAAPVSAVEQLVRSTNFYRNKAKNLVAMADQLVRLYQGDVPRTVEQLVALPGVARKTANVVLGVGFGLSEGIVVDTHVRRVAGRLGLTDKTDPVKIERDLMAVVPRSRWIALSHQLIEHGRTVCMARNPACSRCALADVCPTGKARLLKG
jgi:endonuclease-3